jgi:hypothetical protein
MGNSSAEFCGNIFTAYPISRFEKFREGQIGTMMLLFGLMYISSSAFILYWIKRQEKLAQGGDHLAVKSVIFPVFVKVLWYADDLNRSFYVVYIICLQ